MTQSRYRLNGTVDEEHLTAVIGAFSEASYQGDYDPMVTVIKLGPMPVSERDKMHASASPSPAEAAPATPAAAPKRTVNRARKSNGEWPAKGSIYDIILQAIQSEPKTPAELGEILARNNKSPSSVQSALGRLKNRNLVKLGENGWVPA